MTEQTAETANPTDDVAFIEKTMDETKVSGAEDEKLRAAIKRVIRRAYVAEKQRDLLGGQVSTWIGRFYGQKVAAGDLAPGALPHIVRNEVGALEQGCAQIAQEAQKQ